MFCQVFSSSLWWRNSCGINKKELLETFLEHIKPAWIIKFTWKKLSFEYHKSFQTLHLSIPLSSLWAEWKFLSCPILRCCSRRWPPPRQQSTVFLYFKTTQRRPPSLILFGRLSPFGKTTTDRQSEVSQNSFLSGKSSHSNLAFLRCQEEKGVWTFLQILETRTLPDRCKAQEDSKASASSAEGWPQMCCSSYWELCFMPSKNKSHQQQGEQRSRILFK